MTIRTVFDHIPKTAGTSVIAAMGHAMGEGGGLPETSYPHHVAMSLARERRFVAAHLWFYNGEPLADGWLYASLLRDPVDRFLSQYHYHRSLVGQVTRGAISDPAVHAAVNLDLAEFIDTPGELRRSFVNVQARHFADRVCDAEGLSDADLLDAAIAGAGEYDLIGVYSQLQEFIDAYCDLLGAPRQSLPTLNVTPNRRNAASFPPALIDNLKSCNAADYGLCAWAEQHFAAHRPRRLFRLGAWLKSLLPAPAELPALETIAESERADFGSKAIEILDVHCSAKGGKAPAQAGQEMQVQIRCRSSVVEPDLTVGVAVRDSSETTVFGTNSRQAGIPIAARVSPDFTITIALRAPAKPGSYRLTLALHKGETHLEGCYHWLDRAAVFEVVEIAEVAEVVEADPVMFSLVPG